MKKIPLHIACLFFIACVSPESSWFPLAEGYWWQYTVIKSIRGEPHVQKLVLANLAPVYIEGNKLYPRKRADGRVEYFDKNEEGIFRIDPETGNRTLLLQEPIQVGAKWRSSSKILFLKVTGAFEATYNRKIREEIVIEYEIESIDEVVKVAAGKFSNCMKVRGKGSIYGGGGSLKEFMAIDTINIEIIDWYAPGVGLVKRTRKEFTQPLDFENNYSEELERIISG